VVAVHPELRYYVGECFHPGKPQHAETHADAGSLVDVDLPLRPVVDPFVHGPRVVTLGRLPVRVPKQRPPYKDQLLDRSPMRRFTKSNRPMESRDVAPVISNSVDLHVFVKNDGAEGCDHYFHPLRRDETDVSPTV